MTEFNTQENQSFETNLQPETEVRFISGERGVDGPPGEFGLGYATILEDATIPSNGSVTLNITPNFFLVDGASIQGSLEGVNGELERTGGTYTFTRNESGSPVAVTANKSIFVPLESERFLLIVNTINDLRARPAPNTTINIAVIGEGAVKTYRWDSGSTQSDNGSSVIKPDGLNDTESGRYVLQGDIQATGNARKFYKTVPEGNRIHVSPFGDDNNFGFIPENPVRSLEEAVSIALLLQTNDQRRRDAGRMVQRNRNAIIAEARSFLRFNYTDECGNSRKSWRDLQLLYDVFVKDLVYSQDGDYSNQFLLIASAKLNKVLSDAQLAALADVVTTILSHLIGRTITADITENDFT